MEFPTFDISICNGNKKYPAGTSTFYSDFSVQALSCFLGVALNMADPTSMKHSVSSLKDRELLLRFDFVIELI